MAFDLVTLAPEDTGGPIGLRWDALAAARGTHADIYASHAWFSAWWGSLGRQRPDVLVPAVFADGAPCAVLPLVRERWGVWSSVGSTARPRSRVVLAEEQPGPEVLGALVEQIARSGIRELSCHLLPTRDPATGTLIQAFRDAGMRVEVRTRSTDNVHVVRDNQTLARKLRKLETSTRSRERRITPHWELEVVHYGGADLPMAEGLAVFDVIQERSWKGPSRPATRALRSAFMRRSDELGWAHLSVLVIAGRPVAANSWFRIGDVAIGLSTAYEDRLAVLGPGAILHGHVHRAFFATDPPELVDMLPGDSPFKEQMGPERPPLVSVDACRRTLVRGASFAPRSWVRHERPPVWSGARTRVRAVTRGMGAGRPLPGRDRAPDPTSPVQPAPRASGAAAVVELEHGAALCRYLAMAAGLPSAESVSGRWGPDDRWVLVGAGTPLALARLRVGEPPTIEEIVPLIGGLAPDTVAREVSVERGVEVKWAGAGDGRLDERVRQLPPLPWTPSLLEASHRGSS